MQEGRGGREAEGGPEGGVGEGRGGEGCGVGRTVALLAGAKCSDVFSR